LIAHFSRCEIENTARQSLSRLGVELRRVSVCKLGGLLRHGPANFGDTMADGHDRGSAGSVKITLASRSEDKATFAANGFGIRFQEISRKDRFTHLPVLSRAASTCVGNPPPKLHSFSANLEVRVTASVRRAERIHIGEQLQEREAHFHFSFLTSTVGGGNFIFMLSSVSVMMWETARFRNHFLFDGITNQGAISVLHRHNVSSYASV